MSMRLSAEDLRTIATTVEALSAVPGVEVTTITVDCTGLQRHHVWLQREPQGAYVIRGISDKLSSASLHNHPPGTRG